MKYTDFKDKKVSKLGFGTMRLPLKQDGSIDYEAGKVMVDYAMEHGINYYDTAYMYHEGDSENFVGEAISKYPRDSFYLADKLPTWLCKEVGDTRKIFDEQLKKCKVDYFDFYLLHSIDEESWPDVPRLNMVGELEKIKATGAIRHLGASFHCGLPLLKEILQSYGDVLEFIQLQINYMDWDYAGAKELHQLCVEWRKPIVIMEPLRGGMLANPMSKEARSILNAIDSSAGYPSLAFRFVRDLENVMVTLSGMSTLEQMKANIEIFETDSFTPSELNQVHAAAKALQSDILIPCTGCNYCFECPSGIKIPQLFKAYNEAAAKGFNWLWGSLSEEYNAITPNAKDCIGCGSCESHCPQKIKIIQSLKDIDAKYAELEKEGK